MARFSIYSKDGESIRYSGKPKYNGTYLKVSYLEFAEIASPIPIDWQIGDYIDYSRTGLRYKLYSLPQPKKQGRKREYGASFVYSNVQLHSATKELEIALFNDLVLDADRNVHFSTRETTTTFEDVYGIARRIQASVDAFFPGRWEIKVMDLDQTEDADLIAILSEAKEFQASTSSCLGALNAIYNTWEGIGWIHTYDRARDKDIITIGRPNKRDSSNTTSVFLYGLDAGLTAIKKSYTNVDEFATRLYVYGSDRNLPNRYYNGLQICNADSVDIANLMLPLANWGKAIDPVTGQLRPDASLCYIEDPAKVAKYGLIPRKVYFNGSQNEEIYPSIKNLTVGRLRTAKSAIADTTYVPDATIYPDANERLDKIKSAANPTDDGITVEETDIVFSETKAVSFASGNGYIGGSDNDRDTRPETYHKPIERTVIDYTPTHSGTKVVIEPNLVVGFDISSLGSDQPAIKQRVILSVQADDGTITDQQTDTELEPGPPVKMSPSRSVAMKNEYCIASGKITRIRIVLLFDRSYSYDTSLSYYLSSSSGSIYFGFKEDISESFRLYIKQIGFNLADCVTTTSGGIATLSMKDGMCGGRNFVVKRCTYRPTYDDWELTVKRVLDNSTTMRYPNANFPIQAGDTFVLLDIEMPELYVLIGAETLLEYAQNLYNDVSNGKAYYEPEIDAKKIVDSGAVLKEGMYMQLHDEDIIDGYTDCILIDSLAIDEADDQIPTYKVTLREKKKSSYVESTATALSSLAHQIEVNKGGAGVDIIMSRDSRPEADDNVYSALRSQLEFLSKKYDDIAHGLITFLQGATFGNFAEGITGFGGKIDGSGRGELQSLTLHHFLEVPELRYNRISILVGNQWRAPGGGIIERVEPDYDADGNMLNTGVIYLHLQDGEIGQVALDDICMGIYHDGINESSNALADGDDGIGNFHFSGFYTTYFRVTEILAEDNHAFRYAIRPVSENWPETFHPSEAMHFVAYGNFSDTDRQTARYSTRTYERYLKDVNTWEFGPNNIGAQFGDLSNLNIFGLNMSGYSAYLNNIYMSGVIEQFVLLPYRLEIDTEGQDTLAYGESLNVTCSVFKGWDDVTSQVVLWKIERDTGDPLADAAWNLSSKAVNFRGSIVIEHNQNYTDLGSIGISTLFTITATLSDGDSAEYNLTI